MSDFRTVNFDSAKVQRAGHSSRNKVGQDQKLSNLEDLEA